MTPDDDLSKFEEDLFGSDGSLPPGVVLLTMDQLKKRLLWDIVPCEDAEKVVQSLDLHPASADVEDMEHDESHTRMSLVHVLLGQLLMNMAFYEAEVIQGAMIVEHGDAARTTEFLQPEILSKVIYQANAAVIAELLDLNILHFPHMRLPLDDDQEEDS